MGDDLTKKNWKTTMENAEWLLNIVWHSLWWGPSYLETNGVSFYVLQQKKIMVHLFQHYCCDTMLQAKPMFKKNV